MYFEKTGNDWFMRSCFQKKAYKVYPIDIDYSLDIDFDVIVLITLIGKKNFIVLITYAFNICVMRLCYAFSPYPSLSRICIDENEDRNVSDWYSLSV